MHERCIWPKLACETSTHRKKWPEQQPERLVYRGEHGPMPRAPRQSERGKGLVGQGTPSLGLMSNNVDYEVIKPSTRLSAK